MSTQAEARHLHTLVLELTDLTGTEPVLTTHRFDPDNTEHLAEYDRLVELHDGVRFEVNVRWEAHEERCRNCQGDDLCAACLEEEMRAEQ